MSSSDINEIESSITKILHKLDNPETSYNAIEKSMSFLSDKVHKFSIILLNIVKK